MVLLLMAHINRAKRGSYDNESIKNVVQIKFVCAVIIFHIQFQFIPKFSLFANDIYSLQHTLQSACFKATPSVNCARFKYRC